jgi:hypothetical protein
MGIFADQAKKMREERLAEIKKEADLQKELHNIAKSIRDDFIADMNKGELPKRIEVINSRYKRQHVAIR